MKKLFLLAVAAVACLAANAAYTLNNPIGEDGRYIVKYDCEKGQFAAANDFEADEAVTIAVDVTGTWLADWLKDAPAAEGASRGVAINNWTSLGDTNGDFRRLKQIDGNIWGLTMKLSDLLVNAELAPQATMTDSVVYVYAQFFGFEYTNDNPGAGWWMWNNNTVDESKAEGSDCLFATLPYTGTKTSESFYGDEVGSGIYGFGFAGYASPCALEEGTAVENVEVKASAEKVIEGGHLYLIKDGVRYNALGAVVK